MGGRCEALTAVLMNILVLQDIAPYRQLTDDTPETSVTTYIATRRNIPAESCAVLLEQHGDPRNKIGQYDKEPIAVAQWSAAV